MTNRSKNQQTEWVPPRDWINPKEAEELQRRREQRKQRSHKLNPYRY